MRKVLSSVPSLPDDLLMSCFARVSRLYYPTLSLVSKSFRSLLASPELYKARSLLGHTESCLYLCLASYSDNRWFTLCRKPDQTLTNDTKKSSGYVLARVPITHFPRAYFSSLVAVGSDIYNIGSRSIYGTPSSSVLVMDCRFHTWHEAPSMPVELISLSASVVDGKIYVAGRLGDSKNSLEVLDTKTKTWGHEPISCSETKCSFYYSRSACIDGKFHVAADGRSHVAAGGKVVAYNSKEGRWDRDRRVELRMCRELFSDTYCEIDNVLYSACEGAIRWYDTKVKEWRNLKGLVGLPNKFSFGFVRLADYGGKMAVLWDEDLQSSYEKMIWCAEIMLEKRKSCDIWRESCDIWGKVEWFDHVLTVPIGYNFVKALAATV